MDQRLNTAKRGLLLSFALTLALMALAALVDRYFQERYIAAGIVVLAFPANTVILVALLYPSKSK